MTHSTIEENPPSLPHNGEATYQVSANTLEHSRPDGVTLHLVSASNKRLLHVDQALTLTHCTKMRRISTILSLEEGLRSISCVSFCPFSSLRIE